MPGSPAIGGGDGALAPATDQRGLPRFGPTDIGAFEYQFKVTNTNDSGLGSLRQAIANADSTPGTDTVLFLPAVTGTINLISGPLELEPTSGNPDPTIAIDGPGANVLSISGNYVSRVFEVYVVTSISGLTITQGSSNIPGGVYNQSILTLTDCTVTATTTAACSASA